MTTNKEYTRKTSLAQVAELPDTTNEKRVILMVYLPLRNGQWGRHPSKFSAWYDSAPQAAERALKLQPGHEVQLTWNERPAEGVQGMYRDLVSIEKPEPGATPQAEPQADPQAAPEAPNGTSSRPQPRPAYQYTTDGRDRAIMVQVAFKEASVTIREHLGSQDEIPMQLYGKLLKDLTDAGFHAMLTVLGQSSPSTEGGASEEEDDDADS